MALLNDRSADAVPCARVAPAGLHAVPASTLVFAVLLLVVVQPGAAQTVAPWHLKAAFLFNFPQYVEWPKEALGSNDAPFVYGVLGRNPFGRALQEFVAGETIHGRPAVVRHFTGTSGIDQCHILYVAESEQANLAAILAAVRNKPVLTVSDLEGFTAAGGIIRFVTGTRVRFRINSDAAKNSQLTISPKLLRLAEEIDSTSQR